MVHCTMCVWLRSRGLTLYCRSLCTKTTLTTVEFIGPISALVNSVAEPFWRYTATCAVTSELLRSARCTVVTKTPSLNGHRDDISISAHLNLKTFKRFTVAHIDKSTVDCSIHVSDNHNVPRQSTYRYLKEENHLLARVSEPLRDRRILKCYLAGTHIHCVLLSGQDSYILCQEAGVHTGLILRGLFIQW